MEAVEATASIIGLVQVGLSLAKALNAHAGSIHDSNDDIAVIADDVYATYRHLNDLDLVLRQNEKADLLTADALESARKCVKQAETLIQQLKKLLVKGYGGDDVAEVIERDQIDIGKFRKGIWYTYKSEFELRRSELAQIKADISLIYLTYLALSANSSTERKQFQEEMELVFKRKVVLSRNVKKARERRNRDVEGGSVTIETALPSRQDDVYKIPPELENSTVVYDNVEALYREFEHWLTQEEQNVVIEAAGRKKFEDDAVANYQEEVRKRSSKVNQESRRLRDVLLQHSIPPQCVHEIVKDVFRDVTESSVGGPEDTPTMQDLREQDRIT